MIKSLVRVSPFVLMFLVLFTGCSESVQKEEFLKNPYLTAEKKGNPHATQPVYTIERDPSGVTHSTHYKVRQTEIRLKREVEDFLRKEARLVIFGFINRSSERRVIYDYVYGYVAFAMKNKVRQNDAKIIFRQELDLHDVPVLIKTYALQALLSNVVLE